MWTNGATITIPHEGDKYNLGSAEVEVIYAKADEPNDSLVLMVTYGDTQFLSTGYIEETAQKAITEKYVNPDDKEFKIDLIKMPHHGSDKSEDNNIDDITSSMYRFLRTFMPEYAVISVGAGNKYGHPGERTLSLLRDLDARVYRTDENGDITVKSNGNTISVTTSR